jgi:hypothetical protein
VRTELLYTTQQGYTSDTIETVELYDGAFLQMIGRGEGSIEWAGTTGSIEWTNFPQRRPDGVFMPDVTGVIRLANHEHPVLYRMHGISLTPDDRDRRLFAGPIRWYTDDPDLHWLNDRWGYEEGELDRETLRFQTRAYALHPERPG